MRISNQKLLFCTALSCWHGLACAADISPTPAADAGPVDPTSSLIQTKTDSETVATVVNSSDYEKWVYLDLDSDAEVEPETPDNDLVWDLRFQRYKIQTNSCVTGSGSVGVTRLQNSDFDAITEAPMRRYAEDAADSDDDDQDPDNPFSGDKPWYRYNPNDHTLTPDSFVYIIRSTEGAYFKLQLTSYYDAAGNSGYPSFRYARIAPPSGDPAMADRLRVDASVHGTWIYVDAYEQTIVNIEEPDQSNAWDLAISRTQIQTNSGTSGNGHGGARLVAGATWDSLTSTPTVGFTTDNELPVPGPAGSGTFSGHSALNSWYDYNQQTHQVTPKDQVYALRTGTGKYTKLKILSYADGVMVIRLAPLNRTSQNYTDTLTNPDEDTWVYFDIDLGRVVAPEDPPTDANWDLAISSLHIQTNSGTSGIGQGGAINPEITALDDVSRIPVGQGCYLATQGHICDCDLSEAACLQQSGVMTEQCGCPATFTVDEIMTRSPPQSDDTESGNPILLTWYDYNAETDVISPKDTAYLVRTAQGAFAKIKITDYSQGAITFDWAFAGPGKSRF